MSVRDSVLGSGIVPVVCPVGGQFGEPVLDPQIGGLTARATDRARH
jgi:hypothetical protein